jgi:toxin ParE1/3/4
VAGRPFRFHPRASAELEAAAAWYDERRPGLGAEFIAAVRSKVREVLLAPERWPLVKGTRRVLVRRFPYAIVYREVPGSGGMVEIVAVAHVRRRPRCWGGR